MDYQLLLDITTELGYQLAMCGAETFRVEESVTRIMDAYGIKAEAFAIPNCLHVSIETADGISMTKMRRIGHHGNDLDAVELYSNLSRKICAECPEPSVAMELLKKAVASRRFYNLPVHLIGNFLGAFGFSILFGGGIADNICAGICGIIVGLVNKALDNLKVNPFFRTIASAFLMAIAAYFFGFLEIATNTDAIIIGALMILVPGLLFTNGMRDIIYGDTNSGINRIVQVFLIAAAIVLGTGAAWSLADVLWGTPISADATTYSIWFELIAAFIGCIGFSIIFNIHGPGMLLCALGGLLTWFTDRIILQLGGNDILAYFIATAQASAYSEIMARVRKYPAISYLVVSAFPLIPGAGVYYTMNYAVRSDWANFASNGTHTVAIAGVMAVGILLISTIGRLFTVHNRKKL